MRLLLDTHIWLWGIADSDRLSHRVSRAIQNPRNSLWLSPLSIYEACLLSSRGRIAAAGDDKWIEMAFVQLPVNEAPLTTQVALAWRDLGMDRGDPVDALLAATAKVLDLTLVTADERLMGIKGISVLANR